MRDVVKTAKPQSAPTRPRTRRRRRNLTLYYLMIFTVCVILFLILARTVLFNINEYDVTGCEIYTPEAVLSAGDLYEGRNMYGINIEKTRQKIKDTLIYVEDVNLRRKLPDKFIVEVTEATAYACVEYENRYAIITQSGRYLEAEQTSPRDGLILIKGMELKDVALAQEFTSRDDTKKTIILDLLNAIHENCEGDITEIDITDRTNIMMVWQNRIIVDFGSSLDYDYKLRYIKTIIEDSLEPDAEGEIIYHSSAAGASFIAKEDLEQNDTAQQEAQSVPQTENGEDSEEETESD